MAAYILFIRSKLNDPAALQSYFSKIPAANEGHTLRPLALYNEMEVLEGPASDGVVVIEFPDRAAAKAWYASPAYQAARAERNLAGDYQVILTEGFSPPT